MLRPSLTKVRPYVLPNFSFSYHLCTYLDLFVTDIGFYYKTPEFLTNFTFCCYSPISFVLNSQSPNFYLVVILNWFPVIDVIKVYYFLKFRFS